MRSEYHKEYYRKNKAKLRVKELARYAKNREVIAIKNADPKKRRERKAYMDAYSANPVVIEVRRLRYRERLYGVSPELFDQMYEAQDSRCAVCKSLFKNTKDTCIDHCHKTGKVRGILCMRCNRAIGLLGEDSAIIQAAAKYVELHGG